MCHPGRSDNIVQRQGWIVLYLRIVPGRAGQLPAGGCLPASGIDFRHLLYHLKEPCPSRDTIGFQGWSDRQADGLFRAAKICHHKIGGHWVQSSLYTLHACVKTFQIAADVGPFLHTWLTSFLRIVFPACARLLYHIRDFQSILNLGVSTQSQQRMVIYHPLLILKL